MGNARLSSVFVAIVRSKAYLLGLGLWIGFGRLVMGEGVGAGTLRMRLRLGCVTDVGSGFEVSTVAGRAIAKANVATSKLAVKIIVVQIVRVVIVSP